VIVMKSYEAELKEEVNFVIGTKGCKKCSQLLDFLNEVKAPYIYTDFKNLPKKLKLLIWEAKKETGLKEVSYHILIATEDICFIDEFDIEEIKKNWYANN